MEQPHKTCKQQKQKMTIGIGGGGGGGRVGGGDLGGVLVWGGVVAIATLVSVSAIKLRNKKSGNRTPLTQQLIPNTTVASSKLESNDNNIYDDQRKGLRVLLHDSSAPPPDYDHPSGDGIKDLFPTQIDSTLLVSNESLISDIDTMLEITGQREKATYLNKQKTSSFVTDFDASKQEYSLVAEKKALESDGFDKEKPQVQLIGKGLGEEENGEKNVQIVEEESETAQKDTEEKNKVMTSDVPQIEVEELPGMELIGKGGEEEEEQNEGDNIAEAIKEVIETNQRDQFVVEVILEDIEVMKEGEATGPPYSPQIEAEDNPQKHLVEKEKEEWDEQENIVEMVVEVVETTQKDKFAVGLDPEAIQVIKEEIVTDSPQIEAEDTAQLELIGKGGGEKEKQVENGGNIAELVEVIKTTQIKAEGNPEDSDEVDDEDEGEEEIAERDEENSEGTGDSSMESNEEAIWPAESIEELSLEFKESDVQKLQEKMDGCEAFETEKNGFHDNVKNSNHKDQDTGKSRISLMKEVLMKINITIDASNIGIWIWSVAVLLLVMVAPLLLSLANITKLGLIVFLVVIISQI